MADKIYEAAIIGTGFGGGISACRLSKKWPNGQVIVFERGKRYPIGSFPRTPHDMANNFWNIPGETKSFHEDIKTKELHGMFDIRNFKHADAVVCAGYGGGSLIYANVFLKPPDWIFKDTRWPETCKKDKLEPYYEIAKEILFARPIPENGKGRKKIVRTELFQEVGKELGYKSTLLDIMVFFGNDKNNPLPAGVQDKNRYGAIQTSCMYCAECDIGCNYHSKNTVDLNYLFVAENVHKAEIRTEHLVSKICPLNSNGEEDSNADGTHGYKVYFKDLTREDKTLNYIKAKRVILSAGTLGTNEILLRNRDNYKTLPRLSKKLGEHFSGNGDFLSFVVEGKRDADPNFGPVITQGIDFNLFEDPKPEHAFILEDASYPAFASWMVEGAKPWYRKIPGLIKAAINVFKHWLNGDTYGRMGYAFNDLLSGDMSFRSSVLLFMGIDNSKGKMSLSEDGELQIDWPQKKSLPLYDKIMKVTKDFQKKVEGRYSFPLLNWLWPLRDNVTVHPLGGCVVGENAETGVVSSDPKNFGEFFNYKNLFAADGSIVPMAVGANPVATICAMSERVAEGITGNKPDAKLV